jgi:hypothetical protein
LSTAKIEILIGKHPAGEFRMSVLQARDSGNIPRSMRMDDHTRALLTMDESLHAIHDGRHFFLKTWDTVTLAGPMSDPVREFLFITPSLPYRIHGNGRISTGGAEFIMGFYEDVAWTSHGPEVPANNNDRFSVTANQMRVYSEPIYSTYDTDIWPAIIGAQGQVVTAGFNYEFFPRPDTAYVVRLEKLTNGTHWIDIDFWWHESTHLDAKDD